MCDLLLENFKFTDNFTDNFENKQNGRDYPFIQNKTITSSIRQFRRQRFISS